MLAGERVLSLEHDRGRMRLYENHFDPEEAVCPIDAPLA